MHTDSKTDFDYFLIISAILERTARSGLILPNLGIICSNLEVLTHECIFISSPVPLLFFLLPEGLHLRFDLTTIISVHMAVGAESISVWQDYIFEAHFIFAVFSDDLTPVLLQRQTVSSSYVVTTATFCASCESFRNAFNPLYAAWLIPVVAKKSLSCSLSHGLLLSLN